MDQVEQNTRRSSRWIWFATAFAAAGFMLLLDKVILPLIGGMNTQPTFFGGSNYATAYMPICRYLSLFLIPAGLFYIGLLPICHRVGPYPERIVRIITIFSFLPAIAMVTCELPCRVLALLWGMFARQ